MSHGQTPMLGLAETRNDESNWIGGNLGLWIKENETNLEKQMNEQEEFNKRAVAAIYLQGVLLHKLGLDRDTTHVNDDIMAAVHALQVEIKKPRPPEIIPCKNEKIVDGIIYCGLAENAVLRLREELGQARKKLEWIFANGKVVAECFASGDRDVYEITNQAGLEAAMREVAP